MTYNIKQVLRIFVIVLSLTCSQGFASDALWNRLKDGGLVVLMKHATVPNDDPGVADLITLDPSCKTERNLSDTGRQQAAQLGQRFIDRQIPVEQALHSHYCRTRDTATIAFKHATPSSLLTEPLVMTKAQAKAHRAQLVKLISTFSGKGNLVLVTHTPVISAISFELIEKDTALVVAPLGNDEFEELGKIRLFDSPTKITSENPP